MKLLSMICVILHILLHFTFSYDLLNYLSYIYWLFARIGITILSSCSELVFLLVSVRLSVCYTLASWLNESSEDHEVFTCE